MKNVLFFPFYFLTLILLLLLSSTANAQGWLRFNIPNTAEVTTHPDGGLLVAYSELSPKEAKVAHVNKDGYLIWEKTILGNASSLDVTLDENGQIVVLVFNFSADHLALAYFDLDGNATSIYQTNDFYTPSSQIAAFPGGGMVADVLYKANFFSSVSRLDLQRYDDHGNVLWRRTVDTLQGAATLLAHKGLAVNSNGQSIIGYRCGTISSPAYHLAAFDANGDSLWHRRDVIPLTAGGLADNNFFYVVQQDTLPYNYVLRKIDPSGGLIWEQEMDFSDFFIAEGKYITNAGGGLELCGTGIGPDGKTIVVQSFDNQGNLIKHIARPLPGYADKDLTLKSFCRGPNGGYYLTGVVKIDNNLQLSFLVKMDAEGNIFAQRILGSMAYDQDNDCAIETGEQGLEGFKVKIEDLANGNTFYASSDSLGHYSSEIDSSSFVVSALASNPYWQSCQPDTLVQFGNGTDSVRVDFPLDKVVECSFLEIDISTGGLRRCFDNTYYVRYCNTGTADAENAYADVQLDPYLSFISSSIPGADLGNHRWRFPLGSIAYGDCGNFSILVHLDCDSVVLGQTHCVEAHIYPDSFCLQNAAWSGANVVASGTCNPDSVDLVIKNNGVAANAGLLNYVIIEDNIMFFQGQFQLSAGDSIIVRVPSNGSTWRLEAEQEPFSPGNPMPSATVEGCGSDSTGSFSIGFVSQFGENDGNPYVSVDCQENHGSFDPNDKQAFPKGVGPEHWIAPGIELEYLIRFQNTGTDTAFTVAVVDTLATWLDPSSIRTGASSHPYSFEMSGSGTLKFNFANILLPDSSVNETASHGFVKFFVKVRPDVPLNTLIHNNAGIFFDFNAPVITNTTTHRIGQDFLVGQNAIIANAVPELTVFPNPASQETRVRLKGYLAQNGQIEILDLQGRVMSRQVFRGEQVQLKIGTMPPGLYLIRAFDGNKWLGNGKIIRQ